MVEISEEHKQKLEGLARAYVDEFFKDLQDPKMRGPNFAWERFPDMIGTIVNVCVFTAFSDEEFQPHYKDYAEQKAIEYAKELIC